jgi:hypothetical protein
VIGSFGFLGVEIDFANGDTLNGNHITVNTGMHGIEFWGFNGSNEANKLVTNLMIENNVVTTTRSSGSANIWGTCGDTITLLHNTATINDRLIGDYNMGTEMSNNVVWNGNIVNNGYNAGIAIFNTFGTAAWRWVSTPR